MFLMKILLSTIMILTISQVAKADSMIDRIYGLMSQSFELGCVQYYIDHSSKSHNSDKSREYCSNKAAKYLDSLRNHKK